MKILAGFIYLTPILLLTVLLSCSITAAAQEKRAFTIDTSYGDHGDRHIYQLLREGKADTVIRFDLPVNYMYDSLPDYRPSYVDIAYILYRSGNHTLIKKAYSFSSSTYKAGPAVTGPVIVQNDTLFSWLHQQAGVILQENIAPFAVRYDHTHHPIYQTRSATHAPYYRITLITRHQKIHKGINTEDLDKTWRDDMINLNYDYNTSTKLYRLFRMLEERCQKTAQNKLPL